MTRTARAGIASATSAAVRTTESIGPRKVRKIRHLAHRWLAAHDEHAPELRFDVVGVLVRPDRPALVTHLRAAFL